jgi:tyrosinase
VEIRDMQVQIEIPGEDSQGRNFLGWTPLHASARLLQGPGAGTVDVVLKSAGSVGGLVFDTARTHQGGSSLGLSLPGDGSPVAFWVAGEFNKPSADFGDAVIEVKDKASGALLASKAVMVRIRKNATTLGAAERDRFLAALGTLNARGQGPYRIVRDMHNAASDREIHGNTGFLPWHRAYVLGLERALQAIDPTVAVPYWRFDRAAPALFTVDYMGGSDPSGQVMFRPGHALEHWFTDGLPGIVRMLGFALNAPPRLRNEAQTINLGGANGDYAGFITMAGDPHGYAHTSFDPISPIFHPGQAVRDPLFFLLHCNVDRLWAKWQWIKRRTDVADPLAYQDDVRDGTKRGDTMWPWNGIKGAPRPPTAPGGPFPATSTTPAPGGKPKVDDMLDPLALKVNQSLGFAYDDVPFELPPVAVAGGV